MNTKNKGAIAVSHAIRYFTTEGYEVCIPLGDKADYDLVVERDKKLYRVQVKYAGIYKTRKKCVVSLRVMGGNQSFNYVKKYSDDAFDLLFVYTELCSEYLIPWADIVFRNSLNIDHSKYIKYRVNRNNAPVV